MSMPESVENKPLLEHSGAQSSSRSSGKRRRSSRIITSAWGTTLKVETIYIPKPLCALSPRKVVVMACILLTEMCERLSYYSVVANLVLFCTSALKYSTSDALTISLVFSGTTYLTPIIGGFVADAHIGRFNAIFASALVYIIGLGLLPCSAVDFQHLLRDDKLVMTLEWRRIFFLLGLALVSVGTGGVKANLGPLGAHQVQDLGPKAVHTFFNCYYWFVNTGAFIAFVGVATVQQSVGFAWGFLIPLLTMLLAVVVFLIPRENYRCSNPKGSMLSTSIAVLWQSCRRSSKKVQGAERFFDTARKEYGGSYSDETVDGVISVTRMLPIFACLIMFYVVYSQMQTTFFIQGERMDLNVSHLQVPVAMLNAFSTVALVILIPLLDRVVYLCLQRMGHPLGHLHRIGIGFVLAALAMVAAALVEMHRRNHLGFQQSVGGEAFTASNVTVFLQVPQYALVGCSDAFTSISGMELAYTQAPVEMQGLMTGLFMATVGLGSYLSVAILSIVRLASQQDPWFPDEINDGHAEYLFFLLSGLTGLFFLAYLLAARLHKHRPVEEGSLSLGKESSFQGTSSQETNSQGTSAQYSSFQEISSQETLSRGTKSRGTSSQGTSSQYRGSQETLSQETSLQETLSRGTKSRGTSSQYSGSRETLSQETSLHGTSSQGTSSKYSGSQETSSQGNQSNHNASLPVTVC
ncbi:hypothetical protein ACOMHN_000909 [Nucella lapillus]